MRLRRSNLSVADTVAVGLHVIRCVRRGHGSAHGTCTCTVFGMDTLSRIRSIRGCLYLYSETPMPFSVVVYVYSIRHGHP